MEALVERLGFVELGVHDLKKAEKFYTEVVGLAVSERKRDRTFLTGGQEHHWVILRESERLNVIRIGYELARGVTREQAREALLTAGVQGVNQDDFHSERIVHGLEFTDPDAIPITLYEQMASLPPRVGRDGEIRHSMPGHAVWLANDVAKAAEFYETTLGFKVSDRIEDAGVFMRAKNGYHHSLAVLVSPTRGGRLHHLCLYVEGIDDVIRGRNIAQAAGVEVRDDIIRHTASGSLSTYIYDPNADIAVEFATGSAWITDDDYQPRLLVASLRTYNQLAAVPSAGGEQDAEQYHELADSLA